MNYEEEIRLLIENAESAIVSTGISNEPRRTALIALSFCDMLIDGLNEEQRQAVQVAHRYWDEGGGDAYQEWVKRFAQITDFDQRNKINCHDTTVNRLVWTALNTNTEFDGYACEFLVNLGAKAGLNLGQMQEVLSKYIRAS